MAKTDAATEAKKRKTELKSQFGEFIPEGNDPEQLYKQWVSALFGKEETPDDDMLFRALTMAKLAGIDIRGGLLYIKDGNVIINIDGLVAIADKTGQYGGTSKVEYQYDENQKAKSVIVGIYKIIGEHVLTPEQIVMMDEYDTGDGLWADAKDGGKKLSMLKKVGLAHVIRASFTTCAGLYIPEEVSGVAKKKVAKTQSEMETNITKALAKNRKKGQSNIEPTKAKKA
jgi:hypothetical protein